MDALFFKTLLGFSPCHFRGELYSAGVIKRSKWCSEPRTWCIHVGPVRPAPSTSCCTVHSTTGSRRMSIVSGIVTLLDPVETCTSFVWLKLRGVRSSIGDCLWELSYREQAFQFCHTQTLCSLILLLPQALYISSLLLVEIT